MFEPPYPESRRRFNSNVVLADDPWRLLNTATKPAAWDAEVEKWAFLVFKAVALVLCIAFISCIWYTWGLVYWRITGQVLQVNTKPMTLWNEADVTEWLNKTAEADPISPPSEKILRQLFSDLHINGEFLFEMTEEDLWSETGDINERDKIKLISARDNTVDELSKAPTDFWEYRRKNLYTTSFGVIGATLYPRLSIIYLWWFEYTQSFLPLVHSCHPVNDMAFCNLTSYKFEPPTVLQQLHFFFNWLFFPHLGIFGDFLWKNVWGTNTACALWLIIILYFHHMTELFMIRYMLRLLPFTPKRVFLRAWIEEAIDFAFICCGVSVLWFCIPTIVVDVWFYSAYYIWGIVMATRRCTTHAQLAIMSNQLLGEISNLPLFKNRYVRGFMHNLANMSPDE